VTAKEKKEIQSILERMAPAPRTPGLHREQRMTEMKSEIKQLMAGHKQLLALVSKDSK
jgi:hypothetical protein